MSNDERPLSDLKQLYYLECDDGDKASVIDAASELIAALERELAEAQDGYKSICETWNNHVEHHRAILAALDIPEGLDFEDALERIKSLRDRLEVLKPGVVWWHGTTLETAEQILIEGFAPHTHFAAHMEDAFHFGGPAILEVQFDEPPSENWQWVSRETIPADRVRLAYMLERTVLCRRSDVVFRWIPQPTPPEADDE